MKLWVLVGSTSKISLDDTREIEFEPYSYQRRGWVYFLVIIKKEKRIKNGNDHVQACNKALVL